MNRWAGLSARHSRPGRSDSATLWRSAAALWCAVHTEHGPEIAARCGLGEEFSLPVAAYPVYEMLCGMSLELLFKAIVVARGGEAAHTHRLPELAAMAAVDLTRDEKGILDLLSQAVYWGGRYPVPADRKHWDTTERLRLDHLTSKHESGGLTVYTTSGLSWDLFDELWRKVDRIYWKHHRDSPLPPE